MQLDEGMQKEFDDAKRSSKQGNLLDFLQGATEC